MLEMGLQQEQILQLELNYGIISIVKSDIILRICIALYQQWTGIIIPNRETTKEWGDRVLEGGARTKKPFAQVTATETC